MPREKGQWRGLLSCHAMKMYCQKVKGGERLECVDRSPRCVDYMKVQSDNVEIYAGDVGVLNAEK